jgi:hypothetical protein
VNEAHIHIDPGGLHRSICVRSEIHTCADSESPSAEHRSSLSNLCAFANRNAQNPAGISHYPAALVNRCDNFGAGNTDS